MVNPKLTFNVLTFDHPSKEYTFYFSKNEGENLQRIHKSLVPDEVIQEYGEQDDYYTSFAIPISNGLAVTKKSEPVYTPKRRPEDNKLMEGKRGASFSASMLKRYYNSIICNYFKSTRHLVKPNFVTDTEIWIHSKKHTNDTYNIYEVFSIKVQIARITNFPELLITYEGKSKVFKKSVYDLLEEIPPELFNWVIYQDKLLKYDKLTDDAKRNLNQVFPVWNFQIRDALHQKTEAPDRSNRYKKFHSQIIKFINAFLNKDQFKRLIPLISGQPEQVQEIRINGVTNHSNQLLFGNNHSDISPIKGIQSYGPFETPDSNLIHFFYICHEDDIIKSNQLHRQFKTGLGNFKGLLNFVSVPYFAAPKGVSINFKNKDNPIPEISQQLEERNFDPNIHYMAIYISPYNKDNCSVAQKVVYYQVKELLLKKEITSQAIDANKISENQVYQYSLNNIAIAVLAKLNGVPWRLNTKLKNELIVGVGAFKPVDSNIQYIGSAFSFTNNGKFNKFECFRRNQIDELAGSILATIKEYVSFSSNLQRLIIHYYKDMSEKEFDPIEQGLKKLGLDIPIFIISINKTESHDIVAFDNNWEELMPYSGTFVSIGFNKFLLFNNTRYNDYYKTSDGFPFPVKLSIFCSDEESGKDIRVIRDLIDQVYQFSRMYWKSLRQQNLPVTIKYPEMIAKIVPHFNGYEIPEFGKDNLWFL